MEFRSAGNRHDPRFLRQQPAICAALAFLRAAIFSICQFGFTTTPSKAYPLA